MVYIWWYGHFIEPKIGKNQKGRLWVHETLILEVFFVSLTQNSSIVTNDTNWTSETSTLLGIAVETHFHARHGNKTTTVHLHAYGEGSWLLLLKLVSLLSSSTVQPENTYSYILQVTGQVWESHKRISMNTNLATSNFHLPKSI